MGFIAAAGGAPAAPAPSSMSALIAQYYPRESLQSGEQGTVEFAVEMDREARVKGCRVTKSSGYRRLDAATCDLLVVHADFSRTGSEGQRVAAKTGRLVWKLPDAYRQNANHAPPLATVTAGELEARRLICRRLKNAGSMVKLTTYCLTEAQWAETSALARRQGQDMIDPRQVEHACPPNLRC